MLIQDVNEFDGGNGGGGEDVFEGSEAAMAAAKIRAVFPDLSAREIMEGVIAEIIGKQRGLEGVLGRTVVVEGDDRGVFLRELAPYLDDREAYTANIDTASTTGNGNGKDRSKGSSAKSKGKAPMRSILDTHVDKHNKNKSIKYWPLIRVIRIYTKARVLSTGATLIDIPDTHDSNAARRAVAADYMKKCNAYWLLVPIAHDPNEALSLDLLGEEYDHLCLQLHLDGAVGDVTVVCTKADEVVVEARSLTAAEERCGGLEGDVVAFENKVKEVDAEIRAVDGSACKRKGDLSGVVKGLSLDFEQSKVSDDEKRNRREELTLRRNAIASDLRLKKSEKQAVDKNLDAQKTTLYHEYIQTRNVRTSQTIKADFAHSIRDLNTNSPGPSLKPYDTAHTQTQIGQRPRNYYKELERSLPIFTISSRAFFKLQGYLRAEPAVAGFRVLEDTQIPQLQAHCIALTQRARETACLRFLLHLRQLLGSVEVWATASGGLRMTGEERGGEVEGRFGGFVGEFYMVWSMT